MKFFVGVDGGGSGTRAVVLDDTFQVLGRGESGASNHYVSGPETAARHCVFAAEAAIADAKRIAPEMSDAAVAAWGFGLAGVRRSADAAKMENALRACTGGKPFYLDTDVAAAHSGAFAGGPGIVLSAGTGAIAYGADEHGDRFYADGWGPLMGDEGSGYWLGTEALRAVCRAFDGRAPRTRLTSTVFDALQISHMDQLVPLIHSPETSREKIANLSRLVFDAAENGDAPALDIRQRAVLHLGNSVAAAARAMLQKRRERAGVFAPEPLEICVALRGGLFDDDTFRASVGFAVGERLVEMKRDFLPISGWRIVRPQHDAAMGAALMAMKIV
jgi:N-acetylglucosamine kinase-like BadF-type ATPase